MFATVSPLLFSCQVHFSVTIPFYTLLHVFITLCAKLSGAPVQCIVIGPVCGFVCVCGSVTMITRNC